MVLPRVAHLRILFEHHSPKQVIAKNTFWLTVAVGFSAAVEFVLAVYVIRIFGPTDYGRYAFAFSFAAVFAALFDLGLGITVTREFSRDPRKEDALGSLLLLKAIAGIGILALVVGGGLVVSRDHTVRLLILILGTYVFLLEAINLYYGVFRARQRMELEAAFRVTHATVLIAAVLLVTRLHPSVLTLALTYAGTAALSLVLISTYVLAHGGLRIPLSARIHGNIWGPFLSVGAYFALMRILGDALTYGDSIMLGSLGQITQTGWYHAAVKVTGLILFPMTLVSAAIFPTLVAIQKESQERFIRYWSVWARGTVIFMVLVCVIVFGHAQRIIALLYPESFGPSALALRILVFRAAFTYLHNPYYLALLIFNEQRNAFVAMLVAAVVTLLLNAVLIPRFSLYGAASAAAVGHLLLLVQSVVLTRRHTPLHPIPGELLRTMLISLAAGGLMLAGISVSVQGLGLFGSALLGGGIYWVSIFLLSRFQRFQTAM